MRFRHATNMDELALSPDGKSVVTIDSDQLIVWDAATGLPRWRENVSQHGINLPGAAYGIRALAFSSDNESFCTPGGDNTVIVWEVASGKHTTVPYKDALPVESRKNGEPDRVRAIDVTADGKRVVVGSSRGVVLWSGHKAVLAIANKAKGAPERNLRNSDRLWFGGHYSFGRFSPDGKMLAVVTSDTPKEIRLFDTESGRQTRQIALKANLVRLAFSPDGKRIVATERDVAVRMYSSETGKRLWSWEIPSVKNAERYTGRFDFLWGRLIAEVPPVKNAEWYTSAVAYSLDGKTIAAAALVAPDASIYLLDAETGEVAAKLAVHGWEPWALAFTSDSKMLYSAGWDGVVRRWDVPARKQLPSPGGVTATGVCAASPDGRTLAVDDDEGLLHLLDAVTRADRRTIELRGMGFSHLVFSPDGQRLAAGGTSGDKVQIAIWKVASGELLRRWDWPKGRDPNSDVNCLSFSPDGKRLAAAVFRQTAAYLWDAATGREIVRLPHKEVYCLSFSPDGKTLATAGWDSVIRFWEADNGKLRQELEVAIPNNPGGDLQIYAVCYAPAGGLIATAHLDGKVRIWQADTMKLRQTIDVRGSFVHGAISFSPDGLWLATGTIGEVSLWDPLTGEQVALAGKHQHYVYTVGFGRDGRTLLSGGEDGVCYLWDLRPRGISLENDAARLWSDLTGSDGKASFNAMWALAVRLTGPFLCWLRRPASGRNSRWPTVRANRR